jgi:hypothetical protein
LDSQEIEVGKVSKLMIPEYFLWNKMHLFSKIFKIKLSKDHHMNKIRMRFLSQIVKNYFKAKKDWHPNPKNVFQIAFFGHF